MAEYDGDMNLRVSLTPGDIKKTAGELGEAVKKIFDVSSSKELNAQQMKLLANMSKNVDRANKLQEAMSKLETTQVPTAEYEEVSKRLEKLNGQFDKLLIKQDEMVEAGKTSGSAWDNLNAKMETLGTLIREDEAELQGLVEAGQAFTLGSDSAQYDNLADKLNDVNNALVIQTSQAEAAGLADEELAESTSRLSVVFTTLGKFVGAAARGLGHLALAVLKVAGTFTKWALTKIVAGVKKLAVAAGTAAKNFAKMAATSVVRGIKSIGSHVMKLAFNLNKARSGSDGLKSSLRTILKYGFGIRSFYFLFRKIRAAIKEGFDNLKQYSGELKQSLTGLSDSFTTLKNSVATALAPLVKLFVPIITTIINKVSEAVTQIGLFIASLTGATTFTRATKVQSKYADTLKNTAQAAEETKKQLAGFDDINILSDNTKDNPMADALEEANPAIAFEDIPIESAIGDFAKRLRNALLNHDWEGLGKLLGEKVNSLFEKVNAVITNPEVLSKIAGFVTAITTTFNSLVNTINWPLIGQTLGNGINLITSTLTQFVNQIDWVTLGKSLGAAFMSLINTVDWTSLGQALSLKLNILINTLYGFITQIDWVTLANKLYEGLVSFITSINWTNLVMAFTLLANGLITALTTLFTNFDGYSVASEFTQNLNFMLNEINWDELGVMLGLATNDLIGLIGGFVQNFDWAQAATNFTTALNSWLDTVDWAQVGSTLSGLISGALEWLTTAIETFDWYGLGEDVKEFLVNIDWDRIASALFEAIGAALGGLAAFIWGIIEDAWNDVTDWWYDVAYEDGEFTIGGLLQGILDTLKNIGQWIYDHIWVPIKEGIKKAFKINSPSEETKELGGYVGEGLLEGISGVFKSIGTWIKENVFDKVVGAVESAFGIIGGIATKIKDKGKEIAEGIKEGIKSKWENAKTWVKTNVVDKFKTAFDDAAGTVGGVATTIKEKGQSIVEGIKTGLTDSWGVIKTAVTNGLPDVEAAVNEKDWSSVGSNITSGIGSGIDLNWSSVTTKLSSLASSALTGIKNFLGIASPSKVFRDEVGKMIPEGMAIGIDADTDEVIDSVANMADKAVSAANGKLPDIKTPDVALGKIIPYSMANQNNQQSVLQEVLAAIQSQDRLSRADITEIFTDLFRQYMNIDFYIGDEQIARHSNAGNAKLDRRYNTIRTGEVY